MKIRTIRKCAYCGGSGRTNETTLSDWGYPIVLVVACNNCRRTERLETFLKLKPKKVETEQAAEVA